MYHFFAIPENIGQDTIVIEGMDVNHIKNVLRLKTDDELLISDGTGTDYICSIKEISDQEILCNIKEKGSAGTESSVSFYLFQGLPKSDKLEFIIQKSVELGVYEIIPTATKRSIVKYDPKKLKAKLERWQKISEGAAKQSRRGIVPEVKNVMTLKEALKYAGQLDLVLIPYENFKDMKVTKEILSDIKPGMRVGIFIGPEGGWAPEEIEEAVSSAAARPISLGSRILRTETAPVMLLSVLTFNLEN